MSVRLGRHYLPQDHLEDYRQHESLDSIPSAFFGTGVARQRVLEFGNFPEQPLLSHNDWIKIVAYYGENAPAKLRDLPPRESNEAPSLFREHPIPMGDGLSDKWISLHYSKDQKILFAGSEEDSSLKYIHPETFQLLHSTPYPSAPVSILQNGDSLHVLTVGSMVSTDDLQAGVYRENLSTRTRTALFENLPRSVHLQQVQLGPANPLSFLLSGFGNTVGEVSLMLQNGNAWLRLPVSDRQGSVASYFVDLDGDQKPEIISLISAGAEGVYLYRHENGELEEKQVLSFPPSYGSNSMKLADWDGDGDLDLFITHGDNGDYDPVRKPYHGLRVYENRGGDRYEEALFYPLYGASGLEIEDFDLDGDLDIAVLSFFPDWGSKDFRDFVYLENAGNGQLKESTLQEKGLSRWIVMESGDFDQDGDSDLILGAHSFEYAVPQSILQAWRENPVSFLYLENTTR